METKTQTPSFTVSLRGYDREEVDEYLDSLSDALGHVDDTQEQNRRLQAYIGRLNSRIKDLEDRINADIPKTGAILGERIGILLRSAEDTATDTLNRAEARVAEMVSEAEAKVADAEEEARVAAARGEEQARRVEAAARGEAAEIISEAESRATARTRQIEQWAEQVVSHTRAEEARMLREHQEKREAATAELRALADQRDSVAATLAGLREALGEALGLVGTSGAALQSGPAAVVPAPQPGPEPEPIPAAPTAETSTDTAAEAAAGETAAEEAAAEAVEEHPRSVYDAEADTDFDFDTDTDTDTDTDADTGTGDATGPFEVVEAPTTEAAQSPSGEGGDTASVTGCDDFDAKFEAWVSESAAGEQADGARHFRRD